ncbi:MAG: DNA/RNA nuclease SfsA [Candidatus Promineifilaceae bacterium]|nr:DNA/RNA nuclease SfsA [Candidatus Promineifilaceae bacterium]
MDLPSLRPGRFLSRDNRFRATVVVDGRETWAHVPNSGRLTELFVPGRSLWLAPAAAPHRKTDYDLKLVEYPVPGRGDVLVSVDARLPNPLFAEALAADRLPAFPCTSSEREIVLGDSRIDFRLQGPGGACWVETKSVTLVEEETALFPDAPTGRGRRHLEELAAAVEAGERAAVVFVVQRPDARQFAPHPTADPAFAETLRAVAAAGVDVRAYACDVSLAAITLSHEIPVCL